MTDTLLAAIFRMWANGVAPCGAVEVLPPVTVEEHSFMLTIATATVDSHLLQIIVPTYLPHGGRFSSTYLQDGERRHDLPEPELWAVDGTLPETASSGMVECAEGDVSSDLSFR